jgi:prophage maintenance system killer protein
MTNTNIIKNDDGKLVIYTSASGVVELRADTNSETIWATQDQISELFGTQRPAITKHLKNIFESGELDEHSVSSILEHTAIDGKNYKVKFYNLDAILSVGYRVSSKNATQFRIWATTTLREYLIKGIVVNNERVSKLPDKILKDLEEKISLIQRTVRERQLDQGETNSLLSVIHDYANSWKFLKEYDEGELKLKKSKEIEKRKFDYEFIRGSIDVLKEILIDKREATDLFGSERDGSFQGILKTIYQTFDSKELYSSLDEKASHLLYFIIKDHPFSDGNKRIGSFVFIYFLRLNKIDIRSNGEKKINDNTLVALALLIAESDPKDKELMIALVTNLLS